MNAQGLEHVVGASHPKASRQDLVERHVERVECGAVLGFDSRGLLLEVCRQRVLVDACHASRGLGGDLSLQRAADKETLAHVGKRNSGDERAMLRRDVNETIVSEAADSS